MHKPVAGGIPVFGKTLSRKQRLTKASLFREAFVQNRSFVGRLMVLWLREGEGASLRLGVISSKKVSRRAVDRNLARRRLRDAFRRHRDLMSGEVDVILIARRRLLDATQAEVDSELKYLARKAGLLR
jgi:ribonuclease P protein component